MASGLSGTELQAGALVGDFRVERLLARGGMGVIYEAHQLSLQRRVALKLIAPGTIADDRARARFEREARAAMELEHPNLVRVHAAGEDDGVLFIAMRLIDGEDLGRIIARERPLEPARVARLMEQVAAGLDAAHGRGLVHRDVKPANVMVEVLPGRKERCYVVDFGVAFLRDGTALTQTGKWVGTPAYVAPEQLLGEPVDARTDVYALAAVCFHALTGEPPFRSEHEAGVLYAHLNSPPPRASELAAGLSPDVDAVISRALSKSPAARFASAGEFAVALARAIEGAGRAPGADGPAARGPAERGPDASDDTGSTVTSAPGRLGAVFDLPGAASTFVGRERDLEQLDALLKTSRIVTIVGPGGVGKTRLALQLASGSLLDYEEVRFVELASLAPEDDVALVVARSLGLRINPDEVSASAIAAAVGRRRLLLVLDNCEQIVDDVARFVAALLACADTISLVVTSRQALALSGEKTHTLAPMAVPDEGAGPAAIAANEAVRLLSERATGRAASPTDENATHLASICRRLDGIPLAIELAAGRLRILGAADLDERLAREFGVLGGARREGPQRHRTLEQLIDWSWRLLSEDQQVVLRRLSVLVGAFDLDAAEGIGSAPDRAGLDVCATVLELVDRSLLQLEATEPRTRYRLLEPVGDYCSRQLATSGEAGQARAKHRDHYAAIAEDACKDLESREAGACLRRLDEDQANVRAAILTGLDDEPAVALQITIALQKYWRSRGLASDAVQLLSAGLERCPDAPSAMRAKALTVSAYLSGGFLGDYAAALEQARTALRLVHGEGEVDTAAEALCCLSWISSVGDEGEQGMRFAEEALHLDPAVKNLSLLARLWDTKALALEQLADPEGARQAYQTALRLASDAEDPLAVAYVENHLGHLASSIRDLPAAGDHFSQALRVAQDTSDEVAGATALLNLAYVEYLRGRRREARAMFGESLVTNRRHGDEVFVAISVFGLALTESDPARAAVLHGWVAARLDGLGHTLADNDVELLERERDRLREGLGEHGFARCSEHGAAMGLDDVLAHAATS